MKKVKYNSITYIKQALIFRRFWKLCGNLYEQKSPVLALNVSCATTVR